MVEPDLKKMQDLILQNHYSGSVPSGKSHYFYFDGAVVVFSIPANKNISSWLLGEPNKVWELSRLWAPDGHRPNLLTQAISYAVAKFRELHPEAEALISYADPNVGHRGGVYRAASWVYLGKSEEARYYRGSDGKPVSRRKFHSGKRSLKKAEIEALGYATLKLSGKHRFAKALNRRAIRKIALLKSKIDEKIRELEAKATHPTPNPQK